MTYTIRTILYATDLGPHQPKVFRHAAGLAKQFGAKVHIVYVLEPLGEFAHSLIDNYVPTEVQERLHKEGYAEARQKLQARLDKSCKEDLGIDSKVVMSEVRIVEGRPATVILDEAKRIGADLIVLGSHGHTALDEMLIGSVARKVTLKATVPVLLVPIKE